MTAHRLLGAAFGHPDRRLLPARTAFLGLAAVLAIAASVALQPSPGSGPAGAPGQAAIGAAPQPSAGASTRSQAELDAIAREAASTPEVPAGTPTTTPPPDFWHLLYAFEATGPAYRSLADLGETSEAIIVGSFTGEVEPGREPCDEESVANGTPRAQACVFFANLPFRIDEILAGSLPETYQETVKIEYMVRPQRQAVLPHVVPTDERVVMFIGSKYLRRAGVQDVFYEVGVGKGTFRVVDGRVVPLALPDDPAFGRLEGLPFERFVEIIRRVPILDLMPEG